MAGAPRASRHVQQCPAPRRKPLIYRFAVWVPQGTWGISMIRKGVVGAVCAALAGCGSGLPPGTYAVPVEVAYQRLIAGDMVDFRTGSQCGILIHFNTEKELNKQVRWLVTSSGTRVAEFTVRLHPGRRGDDPVRGRRSGRSRGRGNLRRDQGYRRPALHQPLRPAIEELIAARMGQRLSAPWTCPAQRWTACARSSGRDSNRVTSGESTTRPTQAQGEEGEPGVRTKSAPPMTNRRWASR